MFCTEQKKRKGDNENYFFFVPICSLHNLVQVCRETKMKKCVCVVPC